MWLGAPKVDGKARQLKRGTERLPGDSTGSLLGSYRKPGAELRLGAPPLQTAATPRDTEVEFPTRGMEGGQKALRFFLSTR